MEAVTVSFRFIVSLLGTERAYSFMVRANASPDPLKYARRYAVLIRNHYADLATHLKHEIERQDALKKKHEDAVKATRESLEPVVKARMQKPCLVSAPPRDPDPSVSTQGLHGLFEYLAARPGNYNVKMRCVSPHPFYSDHDLVASMLPSFITYQVFDAASNALKSEGRVDFCP